MQNTQLPNPHAVSYMEAGVLFAVISVFFQGVLDVVNRFAVTELAMSPWDIVTIQLVFGGITLSIVAGFGQKLVRTLRHPITWAIGLVRVIHLLIFILALTLLTATEVSFLTKINSLMAISMSFMFYGRRIDRRELGGLLLFLGGWFFLVLHQSGGTLGLILVLLAAFTTALEGILAESHKELIRAMTFREHCRYTGVVMAVSGFVFFIAGLGVGHIVPELPAGHFLQNYAPKNPFEITLYAFLVSVMVGIFIRAGYTYYMFKAIRTIKTEYYLMVTTLAPFITMGLESLLGYLGFLETHGLNGMDVLGGVILTLGALWMIVVRVERENHKKRQTIPIEPI